MSKQKKVIFTCSMCEKPIFKYKRKDKKYCRKCYNKRKDIMAREYYYKMKEEKNEY